MAVKFGICLFLPRLLACYGKRKILFARGQAEKDERVGWLSNGGIGTDPGREEEGIYRDWE